MSGLDFATLLKSALSGAAMEGGLESAGKNGLRTRQDQALFHEDDPADTVFLLLAGRLVAYSTAPEDEAREQASLLLAAPALIGDRECLLGIRAQETVACLERCAIITFPRDDFLRALEEPAVRLAVTHDLAARFASHMQFAWIQRQNIARRLRLVLPELLAAQRTMPTIDRLAAIARANPKTVKRAVRQLEQQGALVVDPQTGGASMAPLDPPLALPLFHSFASVALR